MIVQVIQFSIVGKLPDYHGEQYPNTPNFLYYQPDPGKAKTMCIITFVLFIVVGIVMKPLAAAHHANHGSFLAKLIGFTALTIAMTFCWMLLMCVRWTTALTLGVEDPVYFKVCVAVGMTIAGKMTVFSGDFFFQISARYRFFFHVSNGVGPHNMIIIRGIIMNISIITIILNSSIMFMF